MHGTWESTSPLQLPTPGSDCRGDVPICCLFAHAERERRPPTAKDARELQAMRVLLIAPPGPPIGLDIGLGYVASATRQSGHELRVLDINNYRLPVLSFS